jgi:hypothetical protein
MSLLESLTVKTAGPQTASKKTVADKWIVSGYIQSKGKHIGRFNVGICEVGKNPTYNSVDAQIALSIIKDVVGALCPDADDETLGSIPIMQAIVARSAMLADPAAISEARERAKSKKGTSNNPLVATVGAALTKLDEMIESEDVGNQGEDVGAALTAKAPLANRARK